MEALLNDFGHVFLLELMMACAITLCGCYTTYTDIHFLGPGATLADDRLFYISSTPINLGGEL